MTSTDAPAPPQHAAAAEQAPPAPAADPALIGLPMFCVGSLSLALYLFGFVGAAPIAFTLIMVNGIGLVVAGIWAASLAASMVAGVFLIFSGFWISLGFTALGLANGWFGSDATANATLETFLISWLVVFVALTLVTLRLPLAFTGIFVFVDAAVALALAGVAQGSTTLLDIAGICVLVFVVIGLYLFASSASEGTGGKPLPAGPPVIR